MVFFPFFACIVPLVRRMKMVFIFLFFPPFHLFKMYLIQILTILIQIELNAMLNKVLGSFPGPKVVT